MTDLKQLLRSFNFNVEQKSKTLFMLSRPSVGGLFIDSAEQFPVWIPVRGENDTIIYNDKTIMNDSYIGVLHRDIKQNNIVTAAEVAYIHHKLQDAKRSMFNDNALPGYGHLLSILKPTKEGWIAKRNITIAKDIDTIDNAFVFRLSEVVLFTLLRTLFLDSRIFNKAGWIGFRGVNGALIHTLATHGALDSKSIWKEHYSSAIRFNTPIPHNSTSKYVDLANVPQDTNALTKGACVQGVKIENHKFVNSDETQQYSYMLNNIPLRNTMNQKRVLVQRTIQSALQLNDYEYPYLYVNDSNTVTGRNAVSYRDPSMVGDTFHISESFAKTLYGHEKIVRYIQIPANTKIKPMAINKIMPKEELKLALSLGIAKNTVNAKDILFSYQRQALGSGMNRKSPEIADKYERLYTDMKDKVQISKMNSQVEIDILKHNMSAEKETVNEYGIEFIPTAWTVYDGYSRGGTANIVKIEGVKVTTIKVGSKLIDRYGNKGTVAKIIPDAEMPQVVIDKSNIPVDIMYNPSIYKRKIGLAFKTEELLALDAAIHDIDGNEIALLDGTETLSEVKTYLSGVPHGYNLSIKGKVERSFRVGMHYMYHLNHDPKRKFNLVGGSKTTFIDKVWLNKMGFNIKTSMSMSKGIARALNYKLTMDDNIPKLERQKLDITKISNYITIQDRIDRNQIYHSLDSISYGDLKLTVGDPRLDTNWGVVHVFNQQLYIPPGLLRMYVTTSGRVILPNELITLNAIVSEVKSIKHQKLKKEDYSKQVVKLKMLITRYEKEMFTRLNKMIRHEYFSRVDAARGVIVNNENLDVNTIGVPRIALKAFMKQGLNTTYALFKRHPVHRVYNMPIVRMVPVDGYSIQACQELMDMLDGDTDGDMGEILPIPNSDPLKYFNRYKPSALLKGYTDIESKKKTSRQALTTMLAYDQYDLKTYTAISGAINIKLFNKAISATTGFTQVAELYHFMAQTSLDFKHSRRNIEFIDEMGKIVKSAEDKPISKKALSRFKELCLILNPTFNKGDLIRLSYIMQHNSNDGLNLVGKSLPKKYVSKLIAA